MQATERLAVQVHRASLPRLRQERGSIERPRVLDRAAKLSIEIEKLENKIGKTEEAPGTSSPIAIAAPAEIDLASINQ